MKLLSIAALSLLAVLAVAVCPANTEEAGKAESAGEAGPQLAHMVFFTLAEDNAENLKKLIAACHKYLDGHEGAVYFFRRRAGQGVGPRGERPGV